MILAAAAFFVYYKPPSLQECEPEPHPPRLRSAPSPKGKVQNVQILCRFEVLSPSSVTRKARDTFPGGEGFFNTPLWGGGTALAVGEVNSPLPTPPHPSLARLVTPSPKGKVQNVQILCRFEVLSPSSVTRKARDTFPGGEGFLTLPSGEGGPR